MNSDPYDSAAWRTFGMLNADETADFDEAMRIDPALRKYASEMDRLSAAIAASAATPIDPGADQLEKLQSRLKLGGTRGIGAWFAVAGWLAAAALTVLLIREHRTKSAISPAPPEVAVAPAAAIPAKAASKAVAKRLTQEIEVLRENLEKYQRRDRQLFTEAPGMALPIVMVMTQPGTPSGETPITTVLGDALKSATSYSSDDDFTVDAFDTTEETPAAPTAIQIYDSARDLGTIVVNNLAAAPDGEAYNLWVTTEPNGQPVYVGSLPDRSDLGADSFDFSLGSTMVLPSGFMLTLDQLNAPANPTEDNIILQGPPTAAH